MKLNHPDQHFAASRFGVHECMATARVRKTPLLPASPRLADLIACVLEVFDLEADMIKDPSPVSSGTGSDENRARPGESLRTGTAVRLIIVRRHVLRMDFLEAGRPDPE